MAPPVETVPLGSQGLRVSRQGLGCMGMSAFYSATGGGAPDDAAAVIGRALELGVTFLDTSDIYGPFTNEELVGKAIAGRREQFTVATKCGIVFRDGAMAFDGSRAHVRAACEASLQRLGVDTIDLYYLHRVDPSTPVSETFAEMKALVAEGKVRYVGISEASAADIRAAHAACPLSAVQLEWSLWSRDVEEDIVPVCRELAVGIVAYSPLGRAFLTGAVTKPEDLGEADWRRSQPRFAADAMAKNAAIVAALKDMADAKGCTPGQLALAWVHAQGGDVVPIPGTTKIKNLESNVSALAVTLTGAERDALGALGAGAVGDRYSDMSLTYHYGKK